MIEHLKDDEHRVWIWTLYSVLPVQILKPMKWKEFFIKKCKEPLAFPDFISLNSAKITHKIAFYKLRIHSHKNPIQIYTLILKGCSNKAQIVFQFYLTVWSIHDDENERNRWPGTIEWTISKFLIRRICRWFSKWIFWSLNL